MSETNNEKAAVKSQWDFPISMVNFFIPYFGLKAILENHLMEDRLPITYYLLLGLVGGIVMIVLTFITKNKSMKIKIVVTTLLLATTIVLNLLIH
jgi:hypothetical protein